MSQSFNSRQEGQFDHTPERRLMIAIIIQAINEAVGYSGVTEPPAKRAQAKAAARNWFETNSEDFQQVCEFAGLHPETVRRSALRYIRVQSQSNLPGLPRLNWSGIRRFQHALQSQVAEAA